MAAIVSVEGFKQSDLPKIEVHRKEKGMPLAALPNLIAIATNEKLSSPIKQFDLSNGEEIADFIENTFIKTKQDHLSLYINKKRIPLDIETTRTILKTIDALVPGCANSKEEQTPEILSRKQGRK